jgi:hypothetical protein
MKNKKISKKELILRVDRLHKQMGRRPQKRDNNSLNHYAKKIFGSWNSMMKFAGYDTKFHQKVELHKFNENFAYFLGLLITDGHIYYNTKRKNYKVAIYTSYNEEKDMIRKLILEIFNYKSATSPRLYGFNKRINHEIRISSKYLADFIINQFKIPSGEKSLKVKVPPKILSSNYKNKMAFMKGVIDGDGYISPKGIKIASGSINFLEGIREISKSLDINSTKIIRDNKRTNTFSIRINKKEDLIKIKKIYEKGYFYPRKKAIISKI